MMYDFDRAAERRNTNSIKWNRDAIAAIAANPDAEPFWVADMDFYLEPHMKKKTEEISSLPLFGYPSLPFLGKNVASWLEKKHQWKVGEESILFSMGLLHSVSLAINLFTQRGDRILVPSPTYRPFRELCAVNGRVMEDYPLGYEKNRFFLERDRFLESVKRSKMILFCSPHNPSGLVFSQEELEFVLTAAKDEGIPVVSDEIHGDLVHPHSHHTPMGKANEKIGADVITLIAPSKTFNCTGEYSSFALFSSTSMKEKFQKAQKALWLTEPGYLIGELTRTAYESGLEWNRELCSYLEKTAEAMRSYLEKNIPEIKMVNADASFITFLDCSLLYNRIKNKVEKERERYESPEGGILSRFFGVEAGVAVNDGVWFGEEYRSFIRFNYGTSRERVLSALERMKEAIERL